MAKVFLYAEYQISYSFGELDLPPIHTEMKSFPGLKSETWLSGVNNNSVGGFYEFDTKKNAQNYADKYLVPYVQTFDANLTVKLFDAEVVADTSKDMESSYF
jgi:hypothetical protein